MNRFVEIALVAVFSPLWLALMAFVAIAVLLSMGRPVIYRDERAGLHGKPFVLFKFRTMREGSGPDSGRITPMGAFLRNASLDELPELFNVLKGDMALVGPRPLPVRYLPRYSEFEAMRHEVRPGITGLAQVNGRNALGWAEKFRYDVEYVKRRSATLDFKILLRTVLAVLSARGISHPGEATMGEFTGHEQF